MASGWLIDGVWRPILDSDLEWFLLLWLLRDGTSLVAHSVFSRPPIETWPRVTLNSLPDVSLPEGQTSCLPVWPSYRSRERGSRKARGRGTDLCLCVCVRLWQGIAYFWYPTLPLSSSAEQLSSDCTVSSCCFFYFLIYFGQMVDYRSRQRLNAAAVTREYSSGSWWTGFSGCERLYLLHFSDPKYFIKDVSDSSLTRAQINTLISHVDYSFICSL